MTGEVCAWDGGKSRRSATTAFGAALSRQQIRFLETARRREVERAHVRSYPRPRRAKESQSGAPRSLSARAQSPPSFAPERGTGSSWLAPGLDQHFAMLVASLIAKNSSGRGDEAPHHLRPLLRFRFSSH